MHNLPPTTSLEACASLLPTGQLPAGDPRLWAHTITDLAAAFVRDGGCRRVVGPDGDCLKPEQIQETIERLRGAGVGPGEAIICEVHNDLKAVATILACWLAGCTVCPVDPDTSDDAKALIARESGARFGFRPTGELQALTDAAPRRGLIRLRRPMRVTGSDLALIIFTSGSSGMPKGVLLSHLNAMAALRSISAYLRLQPADRILTIPPLFFDYGLYQLLLAMFDGCTVVLNGRQTSAVMLLKLIERLSPTVLPVVPALASGLARMFSTVGKHADSIRIVTNTGGHLSRAAIDELSAAFPAARIVPMYGLTESKRVMYHDGERYPGRTDCVGKTMLGLEALVVTADADGAAPRIALPGEVGELHVRGPSVMQGYHSDQSDAGARLLGGRYRDDNWLATGDLFCTDDDGLHYFRGRAKTLIKQGGFCIYPRDIESMAERLDAVIAARVVARQEESGDESAVLFAQVAPGLTRDDRKRTTADLKSAIPRTLMPREIQFIEEWPATPNGKIDLRVLAEMARGMRAPT